MHGFQREEKRTKINKNNYKIKQLNKFREECVWSHEFFIRKHRPLMRMIRPNNKNYSRKNGNKTSVVKQKEINKSKNKTSVVYVTVRVRNFLKRRDFLEKKVYFILFLYY